ncbi:MAG: replicative DNA helicase [Gammaproteobacteria bacterium]|nr:replicative DNA helicase [Gammaproteobacteria bacterium]
MAEPAQRAPEPARLKVPPHSVEAEQSVIGGLMLNQEAWDQIVHRVSSQDFYRTAHQIIFEVMGELANANEPLDVVTISEALQSRSLAEKAGGNAYLAEILEATPSAANIVAYADIVRERSTLRRLIQAANRIAESAFTPEGRTSAELLDQAEHLVFTIADDKLKESGPTPINPVLATVVDRIDHLYKTREAVTGVASGFEDLDRITAGFQPAELIVVAARPSMGKTSLIVNFAEHAVMSDTASEGAVLIFSMEQPATQLVMRMLSSLGHINQSRLRTGDLSEDDWPRFTAAVSQLQDRNLYIDDTPALTPNDVRARARRVAREAGGLAMVMVDYLQLMRAPRDFDSPVHEISEISRSLKAIAREMNCPLVVCSQLNRAVDKRENKRPFMSDLRDSGAIEQDADVILFIYRDEFYNEDSKDKGIAEIIVGKQRNGPIGTVKLAFDGSRTRFDNLAPGDYDDYPPPQ